jgi:hypothetical protein
LWLIRKWPELNVCPLVWPNARGLRSASILNYARVFTKLNYLVEKRGILKARGGRMIFDGGYGWTVNDVFDFLAGLWNYWYLNPDGDE